jgi:hypothetical protein
MLTKLVKVVAARALVEVRMGIAEDGIAAGEVEMQVSARIPKRKENMKQAIAAALSSAMGLWVKGAVGSIRASQVAAAAAISNQGQGRQVAGRFAAVSVAERAVKAPASLA